MEESNIALTVTQLGDDSVAWISHKDDHVKRSLTSQSSDQDLHDNIVYKYFEKKKIRMLFDFMVQHLMIYEPDNPIEYLKDLLDKLLMWRSGTVTKAPQLFEERHVEAIYRALDPAELDVISLEQYHNGFRTLMLSDYILYPDLTEDGLVEKQVFMKNSLSALENNLMTLVKPVYTTLCELTILPDESYDVLFRDYSSGLRPSLQASELVAKDDKSIMSCRSSESCVRLEPRSPPVEDDRLSVISEVSFSSDYDPSLSDAENYEFLIKNSFDNGSASQRRGTVPGSKITVIGGRIGDNAKQWMSDDFTEGSLTMGTEFSQ